MKGLPQSLKLNVSKELQALTRQRVSRAFEEPILRILESALDSEAPVPHRAVVLVGREIAGWIQKATSALAERFLDGQAEIADNGGEPEPVATSFELLVPHTQWRDRLWYSPDVLTVRHNMRLARRRMDIWDMASHTQFDEWDHGFVRCAESEFGEIRVCNIRHEFGARGKDLGPRLQERFLAPAPTGVGGWRLVDTRDQLELARELSEMSKLAARLNRSSIASA